MSDVELIRAEIAALKVHIDGLEMLKLRVDALEARLTAAVAVEKEKREAEVAALRAEIDALREEWRNLATAISANSEAVAQVARRMQAEFGEIKAEQKQQGEQLTLIGRAMDLLLKEQGLAVPA